MKIQASIGPELERDRNLQVTTRRRNKSGNFRGRLLIVRRNKRLNGKAGRYTVRQGR